MNEPTQQPEEKIYACCELESLLARTLPGIARDVITKRAIKLKHRLDRGDRLKFDFSVVFLSELSQDEALLSAEQLQELFAGQPKNRRQRDRAVTRHYKNCLQCGRRFLARRASQQFETSTCRVKHSRKVAVLRETVQALPEAA
jgi:hypothetical protein